MHWHEQERLKAWAQQEAASKKKPSAGPKPVAPLSVVSLPEDAPGILPAAPVDEALAPPSQQVQQAAQHQAEAQNVPQPLALETGAVIPPTNAVFLEEQTEAAAAAAAPPMTNAPCNLIKLQLAEPAQQQALGTSQSAAELGAAHAATANRADLVAQPNSTLTGAPDLDLAAILNRPQRPPAKPLPPVPRFDRYVRAPAQHELTTLHCLGRFKHIAPCSALIF